MLPGAFSAYRWEALNGKKKKSAPVNQSVDTSFSLNKQLDPNSGEESDGQSQSILTKYLKQQLDSKFVPNLEEANMFLAEDRIMCLELYCKKDCNYSLQYIPNANATVTSSIPAVRNARKGSNYYVPACTRPLRVFPRAHPHPHPYVPPH